MKKSGMFLLITAFISGCAATNQTAPQTPIISAESARQPRDARTEIDSLPLQTPEVYNHGTRLIAPTAAINELLQKASDGIIDINGYLTSEPIASENITPEEPTLNDECLKNPADSSDYRIDIRIVAGDIEEVIRKIGDLEEVAECKIAKQDVNNNFLCNVMQLENSLKTRERLMALLADAINVQEVLDVERELGRLSGNIDYLKSRMQKLSMEAQLAGGYSPAASDDRSKPSLAKSILYYTCKGISWLFLRN